MANPGPDIKSPMPYNISLPKPLPKFSSFPPSPKAAIASFTAPKTFLIAGSKVAPPIPAPAFVKLAKVLLKSHDILLLDEPTNHLDIDSIEWLEQFLMKYNGAVILVSHDIMFLDQVTNRTIQIVNKRYFDLKKSYTPFMALRQ